jgi:hypothetical protein
MICREAKADYFSFASWTTQITLNRFVNYAPTRKAFHGVLDDREQLRPNQMLSRQPVIRESTSSRLIH